MASRYAKHHKTHVSAGPSLAAKKAQRRAAREQKRKRASAKLPPRSN